MSTMSGSGMQLHMLQCMAMAVGHALQPLKSLVISCGRVHLAAAEDAEAGMVPAAQEHKGSHQESLTELQPCLCEAGHDMGGCACRPAAAEEAEAAAPPVVQPKKGGSKRQRKPSATAVGAVLTSNAASSAVTALPVTSCAWYHAASHDTRSNLVSRGEPPAVGGVERPSWVVHHLQYR